MDQSCCCTKEKKTLRSEGNKTKLIHRLNRIEGQIRGLRSMVEDDAYCTDILTQASAASAALGAFNRELVGEHLHGCVARDIRAGEDEVIDEFLAILQKLMR